MGLLKRRSKTEVPMVNCKACGRPFPMPAGEESIEAIAQTHQCPYCGETAEYFESDAIELD